MSDGWSWADEAETFESEQFEVPGWEDITPLLRELEDYLKGYWHDPRFALRFALGFIQLLQNEEYQDFEKLAGLQLQDIKPIERL